MREYEAEDIELYLEYATLLWDKVVTGFRTESNAISIEKVEDDPQKKIIDDYMKAVKNLIASVKETIFLGMIIPFHIWLYIDCPLTDHKALKRSDQGTGGSQAVRFP